MAKVYDFHTVDGIMEFKEEARSLGLLRGWSERKIDRFIAWALTSYDATELAICLMVEFEEKGG